MSYREFENQWQDKFDAALKKTENWNEIQQFLSTINVKHNHSDSKTIADSVLNILHKIEKHCSNEECQQIMSDCACQYPSAALQEAKECYAKTRSIQDVHYLLKKVFVEFLDQQLGLDQDEITAVLDRGMGLAGVIEENKIIATKIPKSKNLKTYLAEPDANQQKELYCHCPRIQILMDEKLPELPKNYCFCGAGFYKGIWEEILGKPVRVDVSKSVLQGDNVCQFIIHLEN